MIALFHECDEECKGEDLPVKRKWQIDEWAFERCPKRECNRDVLHIMKFYRFFRNNVLLNSGGLLDQSNRYIEMMDYIDLKLSEHKAQNGRQ